ncbi:MAG: hypothetical protein VKK04_06400 [Synechococcales bacterium]|nr:hypothetical protein [Synechococcales bacterium]
MSRRLPDIVELISRQVREVRTFIKHPGAILRMHAWRKARSVYENAELPGRENQSQSQEGDPSTGDIRTTQADPVPYAPESKNGALASPATATLTHPQHVSEIEPSDALLEDGLDELDPNPTEGLGWMPPPVPLLAEGEPLRGSHWYRYEMGRPIHRQTGVAEVPWVRWYEATNQADERVTIQEYLLSETDFNPAEIQDRQKAFARLVNFNLNTLNGPGEGRDFRLLRLVEAFAPPFDPADIETAGRCYLVAKPLPGFSLRDYVAQHGSLHPSQIREVLRQVLQTLQFLHTVCRIQFSTSHTERGIPHGNLSLDSLFIRQTDLAGVNSDRQFFIHVTDLLLWEHLIHPPASPKFHGAIAQTAQDLGSTSDDLQDLGRIGFQLAGHAVNPDTGEIPGLRTDRIRQTFSDQPLYHFLCRLVQEEAPFKTADEALQALRDLSAKAPTESRIPGEPVGEGSVWRSPWLARLGLPVAALVLLLMGTGAWIFLREPNAPILSLPEEEVADEERYLSAIPVPGAPIQYQVEIGGAWHVAMFRTMLNPIAESQTPLSELGDNYTPLPLMDEIEKRHPSLRWLRSNQSRFRSRQGVLRFVEQSPQNIGLIRLPESLPADLTSQPIAYDGLTVLVPFRDAYNVAGNVPERLDGYISLEELRELYTSEDLNAAELRGIPVQLYFPDESEPINRDTIQLFKEQVLDNDPDLIRRFEVLQQQAGERDRTLIREYGLKANLYEKMFFAYENSDDASGRISIGFDRLSRAFGQCSVYPLAIGSDAASSTQPLMQVTDQPIQTDIDLCGVKGLYYVNLSEDYPLRYELGLVYRQGSEAGEAVGKILSTQEAQYLISEAGLVPTVPMQELWSFVWSQEQDETNE